MSEMQPSTDQFLFLLSPRVAARIRLCGNRHDLSTSGGRFADGPLAPGRSAAERIGRALHFHISLHALMTVRPPPPQFSAVAARSSIEPTTRGIASNSHVRTAKLTTFCCRCRRSLRVSLVILVSETSAAHGQRGRRTDQTNDYRGAWWVVAATECPVTDHKPPTHVAASRTYPCDYNRLMYAVS